MPYVAAILRVYPSLAVATVPFLSPFRPATPAFLDEAPHGPNRSPVALVFSEPTWDASNGTRSRERSRTRGAGLHEQRTRPSPDCSASSHCSCFPSPASIWSVVDARRPRPPPRPTRLPSHPGTLHQRHPSPQRKSPLLLQQCRRAATKGGGSRRSGSADQRRAKQSAHNIEHNRPSPPRRSTTWMPPSKPHSKTLAPSYPLPL